MKSIRLFVKLLIYYLPSLRALKTLQEIKTFKSILWRITSFISIKEGEVDLLIKTKVIYLAGGKVDAGCVCAAWMWCAVGQTWGGCVCALNWAVHLQASTAWTAKPGHEKPMPSGRRTWYLFPVVVVDGRHQSGRKMKCFQVSSPRSFVWYRKLISLAYWRASQSPDICH